MSNPLGQNLLDGGCPFYKIYATKCGYLGVGNLEPKFFTEMVKALELSP